MFLRQSRRHEVQVIQQAHDRKLVESSRQQLSLSVTVLQQQQQELALRALIVESGEMQIAAFKQQYFDHIQERHAEVVKCTAALSQEVLVLRTLLAKESKAKLGEISPLLSEASSNLPYLDPMSPDFPNLASLAPGVGDDEAGSQGGVPLTSDEGNLNSDAGSHWTSSPEEYQAESESTHSHGSSTHSYAEPSSVTTAAAATSTSPPEEVDTNPSPSASA
eukprot:CAMPEP_0183371962 /NCGR_PEP_ID=MMETSP0164_2-20130417/107053_1 /TAXON_ID=221442 /ORGANISM="Coccolithus pelagicus ssp braarudi, Strain PLY182g" /LENGTH=219 /DNA_ID=CAMNT_0025548599 /DNA_START=1 /DNA_END=657 /DNA_ORIENTATION=-